MCYCSYLIKHPSHHFCRRMPVNTSCSAPKLVGKRHKELDNGRVLRELAVKPNHYQLSSMLSMIIQNISSLLTIDSNMILYHDDASILLSTISYMLLVCFANQDKSTDGSIYRDCISSIYLWRVICQVPVSVFISIELVLNVASIVC